MAAAAVGRTMTLLTAAAAAAAAMRRTTEMMMKTSQMAEAPHWPTRLLAGRLPGMHLAGSGAPMMAKLRRCSGAHCCLPTCPFTCRRLLTWPNFWSTWETAIGRPLFSSVSQLQPINVSICAPQRLTSNCADEEGKVVSHLLAAAAASPSPLLVERAT